MPPNGTRGQAYVTYQSLHDHMGRVLGHRMGREALS